MRRQRRLVLLRMERASRNPAKPEAMQQLAHRALGQADAPLLRDLARQIDTPPANHPVFGELWTGPHPPRHHRGLLAGELCRRTRRALVAQTAKPPRIVAMHPSAQALPVHPTVCRGLPAGAALKHQRQSQHPPRRRRIPAARRCTPLHAAARRCTPKPRRIQIPPRDLNCPSHPTPHISTYRDRIELYLAWQPLRIAFSRRWYYLSVSL